MKYGEERGVGLILWLGYLPFCLNRWRSFASTIPKWASRDSRSISWTGTISRWSGSSTMPPVRPHGTSCCSTCTAYSNLRESSGPIPTSSISKACTGLEQVKWSPVEVDQVTYDVMVPFIRMMAGPMDYTQGAMRNASKANFRPVNSEPMSQGTRLPAAGRVCRVRCSARDAVRLPVGLRTGTRMPALHLRRAYRLG